MALGSLYPELGRERGRNNAVVRKWGREDGGQARR